MGTIEREVEVELSDTEYPWCNCLCEVIGREVDASFSHEFGVKEEREIFVDSVEILDAIDEDGDDLFNDLCADMKEKIEELAKAQFLKDLNAILGR